jgi:hypothetical protein
MMHDPLTVALEIKYPWKRKTSLGSYRESFITIWHKDPCKDGSDNSCDWHGSKKRSPAIDEMGAAIRKEYKEGMSATKLAKKYGIGRSNAFEIVAGRRWAHLLADETTK